ADLVGAARLGAAGFAHVPEVDGAGAPFGLEEILEGRGEIAVEARRIVSPGAGEIVARRSIRIEDLDVPETLVLKAQRACRDALLDAALAARARLQAGVQASEPPSTHPREAHPDRADLVRFRRICAARRRATRRAGLRASVQNALAAVYL